MKLADAVCDALDLEKALRSHDGHAIGVGVQSPAELASRCAVPECGRPGCNRKGRRGSREGNKFLLDFSPVRENEPVSELHYLAVAEAGCDHHVVAGENRRAARDLSVGELGARSVRHLGYILRGRPAGSIFL